MGEDKPEFWAGLNISKTVARSFRLWFNRGIVPIESGNMKAVAHDLFLALNFCWLGCGRGALLLALCLIGCLANCARASELLEVLPLTDQIIMLHFNDGHVIHHQRGQSRSDEKVLTDPLDIAAASSPETYQHH